MMKVKLIGLLFFFPFMCFAQLKTLEIKEKTGVPYKIFREPNLEAAVIVFVYAPNLDEIKFKATQGWIKGTEPKYDEEKYRWELYLPVNVRNEIRVNSKGFNEGTISIDAIPKSQISYEVYEKIIDLRAAPRLTIKSDPSDAKVVIKSMSDDKVLVDEYLDKGTFFTDKLRAGMVRISVEKELFKPVDSLLELKNGEAFSIEFKLESVAKFVQISTDPSDAELFLNSKKVDNPFFDNLEYGSYTLTSKSQYFRDKTIDFTISSESDATIKLVMEKKFSKISFDPSVVKNAEVKLDNELIPIVNGMVQKPIPHGKHQLQVTKNKFKLFNQSITIDNDNQYIPIDLIGIQSDRKTGKFMTAALGLGGLGAGLYLMQSGNKNYDAYKNASSPTEAASLRSQVESADRLFPIAFGLGGLFLGIRIFL
jgi:hypothetical protein